MERVRALLGSGTLASPAGLKAIIIDRNLPASHAELAIPSAAVAADLGTGRAVVLVDGDFRRNVLASSAVPGVFPPVTLGAQTLVDGAVVAHVPPLPARDLGRSNAGDARRRVPLTARPPPRLGVEDLLYALTPMLRHQAMDALPLLGQDHVVLPSSPCPLPVAPHDFSRSAELIDLGHATASAFLEGLRIQGAGINGHPHFHPWGGEVTASGPGGEQALAGRPAGVDRMAG